MIELATEPAERRVFRGRSRADRRPIASRRCYTLAPREFARVGWRPGPVHGWPVNRVRPWPEQP